MLPSDGKPYAVFATAPSMNGYTSMNAAITVDGHKKTLPAATPLGVFIDLEVLAAAPARMIRAGLGDSLCRSTAQGDWLLSHHLLGTPYPSGAVRDARARTSRLLLDAPEALLRGDPDAMRALARTLVLSGLGMTICGGSYPASQGEHLISHYIDMFAPAGRAPYFHGEQVAVATLTMARIQEELLAAGPPRLHASRSPQPSLQTRFGAGHRRASCWHDSCRSVDDATAAASLDRAWRKCGTTVSQHASVARRSPRRARSVMKRAGVSDGARARSASPPAFYAAAVRNARFLRDRYTFLDLADDSGHALPAVADW